MNLKIITNEEKNKIYDILFYAKKPFNNPKLNDEQRIEEVEIQATELMATCKLIRERWIKQEG